MGDRSIDVKWNRNARGLVHAGKVFHIASRLVADMRLLWDIFSFSDR